MGNVISSRAWRPADTYPMLAADPKTGAAPLFLDEIEPTTAAWSQEGRCVTIQRFFGWLPDSNSEKLKQDQKSPLYTPWAISRGTISSRKEAMEIITRWYRSVRARRMWRLISVHVLEVARQQIEDRVLAAEEEDMLLNFRQILSNGFSAQKVSISGELKNVQLRLVLKAEQEECYLTWTPSRKRQPRIHLCDVEEVVPVLKEGNKHVPHLAKKVSHRRGFIILCKSHHRGRVVLQVSSKRERKILLLGFQKLLEELNEGSPVLDDEGAIRKRRPRRQSAIEFFGVDPSQSPVNQVSRNDDKYGSMSGSGQNEAAPVNETQGPASPTAKLAERQSTSFERFYQTRYDESLSGPAITAVSSPSGAGQPSFTRRSSMVM